VERKFDEGKLMTKRVTELVGALLRETHLIFKDQNGELVYRHEGKFVPVTKERMIFCLELAFDSVCEDHERGLRVAAAIMGQAEHLDLVRVKA